MSGPLTLALAGNPNAGKTSIFNALTGSRHHVGNWPGNTVAKMEGTFLHGDLAGRLVDLPGTYSLSALSPEEIIARDYLLTGEADPISHDLDGRLVGVNLELVGFAVDDDAHQGVLGRRQPTRVSLRWHR